MSLSFHTPWDVFLLSKLDTKNDFTDMITIISEYMIINNTNCLKNNYFPHEYVFSLLFDDY